MPNYPVNDYGYAAQMQDPNLALLGNRAPKFSFGQNVQSLLGTPGAQDFALSLLANSGSSPQRRSLGEIIGQSGLQAQQMGQQRTDDAFKQQMQMAQLQRLQNAGGNGFGQVNPSQFTPQSLAKFAQTKNYGDLERVPREIQQLGDPNIVRQFKYRQTLPPDQQRVFDDQLRQNYKDQTVAGASGVTRLGPQPTFNPLSTSQQEIDFAAQKKAAEGQAGAIGAGAGGIIADIQKKGASAKTINNVLDLADPLIDASTGSLAGAATDKIAGAFGKSLSGAEASAQLQVLQAGLMLNQPRMEGPQSDADVALYRAAAGQIGDPTVPAGIKKAALKTIRQLQTKYQERAAQPFQLTPKPAAGGSGWSIAPAD